MKNIKVGILNIFIFLILFVSLCITTVILGLEQSPVGFFTGLLSVASGLALLYWCYETGSMKR